jgi:uncharacterized protein (TIGR04255 family)
LEERVGVRYKTPPIIEAVCEFRFDPTNTWDITIPGLVYEALRQRFPQRQTRKGFHLELISGDQSVTHKTEQVDMAQFLSVDKTRLAQVAPDLISVNHLAPYESWNAFLPDITLGFQSYCKVAEPGKLQRIGLRYINRVPEVSWDQFAFRPFFETRPALNTSSFILGIEIPFENERDRLRMQLSNALGDTHAVILDLDYYLAAPGAIEIQQALSWVEQAHTHLESAFEDCLSDGLRQRFEPQE